MRATRQRRGAGSTDFWPGYVDVLSTILLVLVFLLSLFMIAQYWATQEASGKDNALRRLTRQIAELTSLLSLEKGKSKTVEDELSVLQASIASLQAENARLTGLAGLREDKDKAAAQRIAALGKELDDAKSLSNEALAKVDLLNQQLLALRRQMAALQAALAAAESKEQESQARIADLGSRLNLALARKVQELQRYRSDFFGRLGRLLEGRRDIRVVGDRFIFQSEVLFPSGQAQMTVEGLAALDQLAAAIVELERQIPAEVDWALQVDGHTDSRPIASRDFPSNWELSTSRAISVVRYLVGKGVSPRRLVAAGYGEFQPLEPGEGEEALRRNRRIELKLTNR
jgi:chemotaxis protein MotB